MSEIPVQDDVEPRRGLERRDWGAEAAAQRKLDAWRARQEAQWQRDREKREGNPGR